MSLAAAARLMRMTDATWLRHANPWSGWTRFAILPGFALAAWSRVWIGWTGAGLLATALVAWTFANPRAFPPPTDFGAWISRGVLGERLYLSMGTAVPPHHRRAATRLAFAAALGLVPLALGLAALAPAATLLGLALAVGGKMWFIDRMVWVHADLTGAPPGVPLRDPGFTAPKGTAP